MVCQSSTLDANAIVVKKLNKLQHDFSQKMVHIDEVLTTVD